MNKKLIFALLGVFLMTSGIFTLVAYIPAGNIGVNQPTPALSNVGETGTTSLAVNYWANGVVANSGTTSLSLSMSENTSQNLVSLNYPGSDFTFGTSSATTGSLSIGTFYYYGFSTLGTFNMILPTPVYTAGGQVYEDVGTVYVNISVVTTAGTFPQTFSWSYAFDANSELGADNSWIEIAPSLSLAYSGFPIVFSVSFSITTPYATSSAFNAPNGVAIGAYTYSGSGSNSVILSSGSPPAQASQPFVYGWYFNSASTSFTIPQYESSFDLTWSSSSTINPQYYDQSPSATSGNLTGSLTSNSFDVYPVGDPPDVNDGSSTYTFSYYLSSQYQVSSATATQTASPSYTYSAVSGTTNQANSSFSFSGSTPSSAYFGTYKSGTSSLSTDSTSISFTPTVTISNPYYTYAQNQLTASLSGASTGSLSPSSNVEDPSFTGSSVTYTSSTSPSWTVSLNLYGNRHPVYDNSAISLATVNPLTPVVIYANYTEYFSGETQYLQSSWNGHALTSSGSTTDQVQQTSYFHSPGSKTISFYANNSPNPSTNGLSPLDSGTNSFSVSVLPFSLTPSPVDYTSVGTSVPLSLSYSTQTSAEMTIINLTVNGVLEDRFQPDLTSGTVKYDFTQPVSAPLLVTWQAVDQYGYSQSITFQYGSNLTPAEYSNKVTVLQSANATHSYPISLSGVPAGTGYYQQLITIDNPSQYGINKAASNIQFVAGNSSLLYAWIQSINSSSMQVWVKNYYGDSVVDMQVLPSFENDFSATGYLGTNPLISSTTNNWAEMIKGLSLNSVKANPNDFVGYGSGATGWENVSGVLRQTLLSNANDGGNGAVAVLQNQGAFYNNRSYSLTMTFNYTGATNPRIGSVSNMYPYGSNGSAYTARTGYRFFMTGNTNTGQAVSFLNDQVDWVDTGDYTTSTGTDYTLVVTNNNGSYSYSLYAGSGTSGTLLYSASGISYSANNRQGQNFGFLGISDSATSSTYSTSRGSLPMNVTSMSISILGAPPIMPTFAIGTGSVFQANATTTSSLSGTPGQQYNSTFQYFSFQIPLAPGTNYTTVIWNSTWTLSNAYPSTFLPISSGQNYITFEDLSGFSFIQVQLIEPSSQINTMEQVQLSPYQEYTNESLVTFQSYFSLSVSYTPFQSAASQTIKPSSMGFSLPYGSTATADIYSPWHQLVGSSSFNVTSSFVQVNVPLNVTFAYFIDAQTNATFSGETISANGYNNSYLDPMVVANGSSYSYAVSTIDPQTYQLENYPGIFTAKGTSQKIYVNVGMPLASALVNVYAYNQSGLNELGNGGPTTGQATAYLYIGGVRQSLSSTFTGQLGQTYPVKITDVLGNVLYTGNLTLNQPSKTINIYINTPSYAVQFVNQEDVPASSPLAIQHSSLNMIGSDVYYNFSTRVGQQSTIYLARGEYHLYTHDNLTNSLNFSITNETVGFDFNGPNILAITESAINNTNHGIILNPISQPGNLIPGQNATWLLEPEFKNGTLLSSSEISNSTFQFIVTNSSGSFLPEIINHTVDQGYLRVTFHPTTDGSMTFAMKETYDNNSGAYSNTISITPITPASHGLQETITVPSTVQERNATAGTIIFALTSTSSLNPTTPDHNQTISLIANTSVELIYKGNFAGILTMYYIQPGEGAFALNISALGTGYQVLVITKPTDISGQNVSFTGTSSAFTVSSANPANPSTGWDQFIKIATGIDAEIFYLIVTLATVGYEIYKYLRRRDIELTDEENQAGLMMESMTMFQVLVMNAMKQPVPPELQQIFNAIPAKRRNKIFSLITSRRRAILPKPMFLQKLKKKKQGSEQN